MNYFKKIALLTVSLSIPLSGPLAHEITNNASGFIHMITAPEHLFSFFSVALLGAVAASFFRCKTYIYLIIGISSTVVALAHVGIASFYWVSFIGGFVCASILVTFYVSRVMSRYTDRLRLKGNNFN